jgi:tripartite-type tricarboxylate transporter receptor subunit TctC
VHPVSEAGVPGIETSGFNVLVAPAGTPREAIDAINAAMNKTLANAEVRERLEALGTNPMSGTPEQLGQFLKKEIDKWAGVIRTANIKID